MLYIVTALYIEAKPLISLFNLKKDNSYTKFQVFSNEDVKLIISGTGKVKSATALTYLISKEDIKKNDYIVNIGFVASNKNSQLGDIVYVSKIQNAYSDFDFYPEMIYKHNFLEGSLTTFDSIVEKKNENTEYIDMEAYGFFQTASIFFKKDKRGPNKNIKDKVIFLGMINNPFIFMKNSQAFILSSKVEGFGLVLVEALYCGTKVISSDCPTGPSQILLNGEAGELFEVSNVTELLNKLEIIHNKEYNKAKIEETLERYTRENFINNFRKVIE